MGHIRRTRIAIDAPFELRLAVWGHGWADLEPHRWCEQTSTLETVVPTEDGPADVRVKATTRALTLRVETAARRSPVTRRSRVARQSPVTPPGRAANAAVRTSIRRMLRLDEDLRPFWSLCRREPRLRWVARRGAGRIMRSPHLFEDLLKLLFTTNCSWAATRGMTSRLVAALGEPGPSGRKAFPTAERCAEGGEGFYRDVVRAGYRASSCASLARAFADGALDDASFDDASTTTDQLRQRLLALPGFGPYAAGQALRLLGRHEDLALDSWCRGKLARQRGRRKPPADRTVERAYRAFGPYKGLALWMDLTADWHGEAATAG